MKLLGRLAAVSAMSAFAATLPAFPASAAVYASDGLRCTIVGTSGSDHLRGTARHDVICGLGGNDVIQGGGGNDVIDGGTGSDTLSGGDGSDTVIGGSGADHVNGDAGNDALRGQDGNDTLSGGSGSDVLTGGAGNDDESGDGGSDKVYGGDGTNWCTVDPADTVRARCVYDTRPPAAQRVYASPGSVNVSSAQQRVALHIRATDDTGVRSIQVTSEGTWGMGMLVAGTVRDGWWTAYGMVPRWTEPSTPIVGLDVTDRTGRHAHREFPGVFSVQDATPDRTPPTVTAFTASATSADVRAAAATVKVSAHVLDDTSGTAPGWACLYHPSHDGYTHEACPMMTLVSGTPRNGWWQTTLTLARGSVGGDWDFEVVFTDNAHPNATNQWDGPDLCRLSTPCDQPYPNDTVHALPGSDGQLHVTGITDRDAPALVSVTITPDQVDTLPGDAVVHVKVSATDLDAGGSDEDHITAVGVWLHPMDAATSDAPSLPPVEVAQPVSGNANDGTWDLPVTLPQGTPPGSYALEIWLQDAGHWQQYLSPASPYAGQGGQVLTSEQTGPDNGLLTVVQHTS